MRWLLLMTILAATTFMVWVPFAQANGGSGFAGLQQTWRDYQQKQQELDQRFRALESEAATAPEVSKGQWGQPASTGERRSRDRSK